jgi:hypothetical protein
MLQLKGLPTMAETLIPEGYWRNAVGHLVPDAQVSAHDKLRDGVARNLVARALAAHAELTALKKLALEGIAELVSISAAKYEVQMGGEKGNVQITTYDGEYKVIRAYADRITFTEEIEAAKELINSCIRRWSKGADQNICALIDRAFRTDSKGQIKTTAVLELLRLEIDDMEWQTAMQAIRDSIQAAGTAIYVRFYKRVGIAGQWQAISLDLAAV